MKDAIRIGRMCRLSFRLHFNAILHAAVMQLPSLKIMKFTLEKLCSSVCY